jgi:hypothetical protein
VSAPGPRPVAPPRRKPTRAQRLRAQALRLNLLRTVWGGAMLGLLLFALTLPSGWEPKLGAWVLLVLLADAGANWFGYAGVLMGLLPFLSSQAPPEQWWTIFPLIGGSLLAALVVKHAGGLLVLPFSFAAFVLPTLLIRRLGPSLDPSLTLPSNGSFERTALLMAVLGLFFNALVWVVVLIRRQLLSDQKPAAPLPEASAPDALV